MKKLLLILLCVCSYSYPSKFKVASVYDIIKSNPSIEYIKCHDAMSFDYEPLPLAVYPQLHPHKGMFAETFVLKIPQGIVHSWRGFVNIDGLWIYELFPQNHLPHMHELYLTKIHNKGAQVKKVSGRVAVISRLDMRCYGHWIGEVLSRLALLEMKDIEYDWLYIQYNRRYIREMLTALGIDSKKIIEATDENYCIQADELIVPSLTVRRIPTAHDTHFLNYHRLAMYCPDWVVSWLRQKFLPLVESTSPSEKIFISRKNAAERRILNEDEIFALFEARGFKKYCLEQLSFLEQVALFKKAKIVVAAQGSGLTNIVFCNPGTQIVEIYQNQFDSTFWQLSQTVGLKHHCIKTQNSVSRGQYDIASFMINTYVNPAIIKQHIDEYGQDW